MRILHLSDLHLRETVRKDQDVVLDAFLEDVRALHADDAFDLIIISGDIAFSGAPGEYQMARKRLVDPLLKLLDLGVDRLVIVPGNHDVDVGTIDPFAEDGIREKLNSREAVSEFLESRFADAHLARLQNFEAFLTSLYGDVAPERLKPRGLAYSWTSGERKIGVAALDSAWRATGEPDDHDRGHILVGDRQVRAAVQAVADSDLRIAVVHHPLEWLARFDEDDVRLQLEKHFDVVLIGHIHTADPVQVASPRGTCVYLQGGALYQGRTATNSYAAIAVDELGVCVVVRTFYESRDAFDAATHIGPGGVVALPLRRGTGPSDGPAVPAQPLAVPYNRIVGSLVQEAQRSSVIADRLSDLEARSLDDLLVAPVFLPIPHAQAMASMGEGQARVVEVDVKSKVVEAQSILVVAQPEAGLTNALLWTLEKVFAADASRLPVYIHFSDVLNGKSLKKLVRDALADIDIRVSAEDLPPVVVAVDDVDLTRPSTLGRLIKFMKEHPESAFVVGTKESGYREVLSTMKDNAIAPETVFLGPFGRRHLRSLLAKVASDVAPHVDVILQCVVSENLPRTPFVMAALVAVMSAGTALDEGLTETALLERYTALLLNRWGAPEDPKVDLDYRSRERILGEYAAELTRRGQRAMTRLETERFLLGYFEKLGWQGSPGHVLDDLIERRVLMQTGDDVAFRHVALRELFIGKLIVDEPEFAAAVLADPIGERSAIRHAAALKRSDEELLRKIADFARRLLGRSVFVEGPGLFESPEGLPPGGPNDDAVIEERVTYEPLTEEHKDDMWDEFEAEHHAELDDDADLSHTDRLFIAMRLSGVVLRHSELVPQEPTKKELLKEQLIAWARLADGLYAHEYETGEVKALLLEIGSSNPEPTVEDQNRAEALLRLILASTIGMSSVGALATRKLAKPLEEILDDPDVAEHAGRSFFGVLLYCHIQGSRWPQRLERLLAKHGDHSVVRSMARSLALYHYHTSRSLSSEDRKCLENVVADVLLKEHPLPGGRSAQRAGRKAAIVSRLRESRARVQRTQTSSVAEPYLSRDVTAPYQQDPGELL